MSLHEDYMKRVRGLTRLALPESDAYLYRLGVCLYGFASVNSFLGEIICHLDPSQNRSRLTDMTSGRLLDRFKRTVSLWEGADISSPATRVQEQFSRLNTERSDFVHAYPITSDQGLQVLHCRKDSESKYLEVTVEFLDDFLSRLDKVSRDLYEIRSVALAERS